MKTPESSTAFCCCSLQTGTKIIASIGIVLHALPCIFILFVIGMGLTSFENMDGDRVKQSGYDQSRRVMDDKFWDDKRRLYSLVTPYHPETEQQEMDEDSFMNNVTLKYNYIGDQFGEIILDTGIDVLSISFLILLINTNATIILLLGAHEKRPAYLLFWMAVSVLNLIGSFLYIFNTGSMLLTVFFVTNFYFTWVVCSFYTELKAYSKHPIQPFKGAV